MPKLDPDLLALQEVRDHAERAHAACEAVARYSQAEVDRLLLKLPQSFGTVTRLFGAVAGLGEHRADGVTQGAIVVDDEHVPGGRADGCH